MEKIKNYLLCLLITFFVAAILLGVTSLIFAYTSINDRYLQMFVFGIVTISVLLGATILSKKTKEKGWLFGGIFGITFLLIIFLISGIAYGSFALTNTFFVYVGISILSGLVGGIIGVNI